MQKLLNEWRQYLAETDADSPSLTYSQRAVNLIKAFEHFSAEPYDDKCNYTKLKGGKIGPKPKRKKCGGTATIGYGTTVYPNGKAVALEDKSIDEKKAETYLKNSLNYIIAGINKYMGIEGKVYKKGPNKGKPIILNQNQIDALASLGFNIGRQSLLSSEVYSLATRDPDNPKIRQLFMQWQSDPGHQKRREAEADLYFTPIA